MSLVARRRAFLLAPFAMLASRLVFASGDPLDPVVAARARLRTLRASFTQERTLGLLASTVTSRGDLILVRPDRLRWHLAAPDSMTCWVSPAGLAYQAGSSRGAVAAETAGTIGLLLRDLLAVLGGDMPALRSRYDIAVDRIDDGAARVTVVPRAAELARRIRRIRLDLAPDLLSPREIVLDETESDQARIRFADVQLNVPVDPSLMRP